MDCTAALGLGRQAGTVVCIIEPADLRIYIVPALVFASLIVAIIAMWNTRSVARQKATLDLIEKTESTEHYRRLQSTFARYRAAATLLTLANPVTDEDFADRQAVMDYLNHYELVSIGILHNILDEAFYRSWMRGPFLRDWTAAAPLIQRQRWKRNPDGSWLYHDRTFENYQKLACRWSADIAWLSDESGGPPIDEPRGGPGEEPLPGARPD